MNTNLILGMFIGGGAVLLGAALLKSANKEKYAEVTPDDIEDPVENEEPKTFKEKIEEAVVNATAKVVEAKEQIEAITVVVGLFAAIANLRNLIRKGKVPNNIIIFKPESMNVSDNEMEDFIRQLKADRRVLG